MSEIFTCIHSVNRTCSPRLRGRCRLRRSSGRFPRGLGRTGLVGFWMVRGGIHLISPSNSLDKVGPRNALHSGLRRIEWLISLWLHWRYDPVVHTRNVRSRSRRGVDTLTSGTRILTRPSRGRSPRRAVNSHRDMTSFVIRRDRPNRLPLLETGMVRPREDLEIATFLLLQ